MKTVFSFSCVAFSVLPWLLPAGVDAQTSVAPSSPAIQFAFSGQKNRIPATFFGAHDCRVYGIGRDKDHANPQVTEAIRELGLQNLRGPGGTEANFFLWRKGGTMGIDDPDFKKFYGEPPSTIPWMFKLQSREGFPPLTVSDIYAPAEQLGIPYVFNVNISSQSVGDIVDLAKEIRRVTKQPIRMELGNELYAITRSAYAFPNVASYIDKVRGIYQALKQVDPAIQVAVIGVGADLEGRVLGDPNNKPSGNASVDAEATQLGRIAAWNRTIKENPDIYDAVTVHISPPINSMERFTVDSLMQYFFAFTQDSTPKLKQQAEYFGKDIWVTEWGFFPGGLLQEKGEKLDRMMFMKTPGMAIAKADRLLSMSQIPNVPITCYHDLNSGNGFGIIQGGYKLPNFHVFKEIGSLLGQYPYVYELFSSNNPLKMVDVLYTRNTVALPAVGAYGFGDQEGPSVVVWINRTPQVQSVQVAGCEIGPEWVYGGDDPLPNFMNNPVKFSAPPPVNPDPEILAGEPASVIELKPYSMTVCRLVANP